MIFHQYEFYDRDVIRYKIPRVMFGWTVGDRQTEMYTALHAWSCADTGN